eukprot:TRINITY_DN62331_c0_g1_i1.p1 TRINITY_DN62331_c0_g1~~TRINITY_DN62331_c0_g1_i1.p1  ORF type:complete len:442 (+),score=69.55 TRINITY_DN62331_c0_g1_i1:92-1327(+)
MEALPLALVIAGAGTPEVNGVYKASGKTFSAAPIYEHTERGADLKVTREPHTNPSSGKTKHGWLVGSRGVPLYGVRTESLAVVPDGWKAFGRGAPPVPSVRPHTSLADAFFSLADDAKRVGDAAVELEDWLTAHDSFSAGLDLLKRCSCSKGCPHGEEGFTSRGALLLSRRASSSAKLGQHRDALRDALAALELARNLASAELAALAAAKDLGFDEEVTARRLFEPLGTGMLLDPVSPLALRCVERWLDGAREALKTQGADAILPVPTHEDSDRYLECVDDRERLQIVERFSDVPEASRGDGGSGVINSTRDCLMMMGQWEAVFAGEEFQRRRAELWDRRELSYPAQLREAKELVADVLADVLVPLGYARGRPGLAKVIKQMQQFWSNDLTCARKAEDLEDLVDVSLADLE